MPFSLAWKFRISLGTGGCLVVNDRSAVWLCRYRGHQPQGLAPAGTEQCPAEGWRPGLARSLAGRVWVRAPTGPLIPECAHQHHRRGALSMIWRARDRACKHTGDMVTASPFMAPTQPRRLQAKASHGLNNHMAPRRGCEKRRKRQTEML